MAIDQLASVAIGRPITRLGVSLFPIYLPGSPSVDVTASLTDLEFSELEVADVTQLLVSNPDPRPTLILEGETVVGGQQNRTLNASVIVPGSTSLIVPVSCVEAGRWDGGAVFERGRTFATRRVRRAKHATATENADRSAPRISDQGAVWSTIDYELDRLGAQNPSSALLGAELQVDDVSTAAGEAAQDLVELGPLPDQCGFVVSHGARVVSAELLGSPELLAARWEPLVRATILDAPSRAHGKPSASRALIFIHRFAVGSHGYAGEGVGLGQEVQVRTSRFVGQALLLDRALVHVSAFALAA